MTKLASGYIGLQTISLGLNFGNLALHEVTDGDDAEKLACMPDREMTYPSVRHDLKKLIHAIIWPREMDLGGHDTRDGAR